MRVYRLNAQKCRRKNKRNIELRREYSGYMDKSQTICSFEWTHLYLNTVFHIILSLVYELASPHNRMQLYQNYKYQLKAYYRFKKNKKYPLYSMNIVIFFPQSELYLCTPIKVDYTNDYYIGKRIETSLECSIHATFFSHPINKIRDYSLNDSQLDSSQTQRWIQLTICCYMAAVSRALINQFGNLKHSCESIRNVIQGKQFTFPIVLQELRWDGCHLGRQRVPHQSV